jgi:hypothetical protein
MRQIMLPVRKAMLPMRQVMLSKIQPETALRRIIVLACWRETAQGTNPTPIGSKPPRRSTRNSIDLAGYRKIVGSLHGLRCVSSMN